jgi:predicted transcriptional regulator
MTTISFKAEDKLKKNLQKASKRKGINLSAYIKLTLTEALERDLNQSNKTPNNMTEAEEDLLLKTKDVDVSVPHKSVKELIKSLNQ